MTEPRPSRRVVFHGLSSLGVAAMLAGCGSDEATPSGDARSSSAPTTPATQESQVEESASAGPAESAEAQVLATTDEVPLEGGIVLTGPRIVITQPRRGEFQAFSAVCTHQGQTVGEVADNVIRCTWHGSEYDAASGEVVAGPAPTGLDPIRIKVRQGRITRA